MFSLKDRYIRVNLDSSTVHSSTIRLLLSLQSSPSIPTTSMPLIRQRPAGRTVRCPQASHNQLIVDTKKARSTIEAYHFQSLLHRKKIVLLNTLVPYEETSLNPRYVNVEERFTIPRRSVKVHDCRIILGRDMYLVTGYWYRYSDINRSVMTATGLAWRGELVVVRTGRIIPYLRRVSHPHQVDIATKKCVIQTPFSFVYVDTSSP